MFAIAMATVPSRALPMASNADSGTVAPPLTLLALMSTLRDVICFHVAFGQELQCARAFQGEGRVRATFVEAVLNATLCSTLQHALPHPLLHDDLCESLCVALGHEQKLRSDETEMDKAPNPIACAQPSTQAAQPRLEEGDATVSLAASLSPPTCNLPELSTVTRSGWRDAPLSHFFKGALLIGGLVLDLPSMTRATQGADCASSAPALLILDASGRLGVHLLGVDPRTLAQDFVDSCGSDDYEQLFAFETLQERKALWQAMHKLSNVSAQHACARQSDTSALVLAEAHATLMRLRYHKNDKELQSIWAAYNVVLENGAKLVDLVQSQEPHIDLLDRRLRENLSDPLHGWSNMTERAAYVVFHALGHESLRQQTCTLYNHVEKGLPQTNGLRNEGVIGHIRTNMRYCMSTALYHAVYDTLFVMPLDMTSYGHPLLPTPETYANGQLVSPELREQLETHYVDALEQPMLLSAVNPTMTKHMVKNTFSAIANTAHKLQRGDFEMSIEQFFARLASDTTRLFSKATTSPTDASFSPIEAIQAAPTVVTVQDVDCAPAPATQPAIQPTLKRDDSCDSFDEWFKEEGALDMGETQQAVQQAECVLHTFRTDNLKRSSDDQSASCTDLEVPRPCKILKTVSQTSIFGASTPTTTRASADVSTATVDATTTLQIEALMYASLIASASRRRAWQRARKQLTQKLIISAFKTNEESKSTAQLAQTTCKVNGQWLDCQNGILDALYVHFDKVFDASHTYVQGFHTVSTCLANLREAARRSGTNLARPWSVEDLKDTSQAREALQLRLQQL